MTDRELMQQALEALEQVAEYFSDDSCEAKTITALRERLAQPDPVPYWHSEFLKHNTTSEQPAQPSKPVVWMYVNKSTHETKFQKHMRDFVDHSLWSEVPLYGEPLANHELRCVCGAVWLGDEMVHLPDKHPPANANAGKSWVHATTWRGLTEEELEVIANECRLYPRDFARAIEAKLREKNA